MAENSLSERDICTKFITPAVEKAGWYVLAQVREEVSLTAGRVIVRGKLVARGKSKRADYLLYLKSNLPMLERVKAVAGQGACDEEVKG